MEQFDLDKIKHSFFAFIEGKTKTADELEFLLQQFPFCQSLHILQADQHKDTSKFDGYIAKAALYSPDRAVLYNIIHHKEFPEPTEIVPKNTAGTFDSSADINTAITEIVIEDEIEDANILEEIIEIKSIGQQIPPSQTEAEEASESISEKPFFDNLASSDYFKFNKSSVDPLSNSNSLEENQEVKTTRVSRYNDDTMPYSFLWWLHKTRKEHSDTYQPYVDFKLDTSQKIRKGAAEELNHQIIENIFHLQVPLKEEQVKKIGATVEFELKRKEEDIIEKFIKEEPQIRSPKAETIDTENKARRSSEDNFDLVSETLAQIYIEQMLYHKAIDTYKKLSLKFPEKSAYFAGQITELQKKIN